MSNESILLVDDEEAILVSIGWVLEKNNFKVTTATNGQKAIDLLQANRYDLVITDLRMNGIDGVAVLKQAKALSPDTGVIILTGYGDVDSAVKTLKLGADDYLQKPCNIEDLLYRAKRSFETQGLVVKLREQNEQLKSEIASRKIIEMKLLELRANLEQQVEKRTTELNYSFDELKTVLNTLLIKEKELEKMNRELQDNNTTLSTILKRREREHNDIRQDIAAFEKLKGEIVNITDPQYVKARNELASTVSPLLGLTPGDVRTTLISIELNSSMMDALSPESREAIPAAMALYLIHPQSFLTDGRFLGFPFHYFYSAVFLLVLFVGLCWLYCVRADRRDVILGIDQ